MALHDQRRGSIDPGPLNLGSGPSVAVFLHGLTGSPYEVEPLARAMYDAGYAAHAPKLPGHEDLDALERSTRQDWYQAASAAVREHLDAGSKVLLVGFSMGSLLALQYAARNPGVLVGVVAISVPLRQPAWQRPLIRTLSRLRKTPFLGRALGRYPKSGGPDIRIQHEVNSSPSLTAFPYPTLEQFALLQEDVQAALPQIVDPVLLIHGQHDHVADVECSRVVSQRVASQTVKRVVLPASFHIVGRDVDREQAATALVEFAAQTLGPPPAQTS